MTRRGPSSTPAEVRAARAALPDYVRDAAERVADEADEPTKVTRRRVAVLLRPVVPLPVPEEGEQRSSPDR